MIWLGSSFLQRKNRLIWLRKIDLVFVVIFLFNFIWLMKSLNVLIWLETLYGFSTSLLIEKGCSDLDWNKKWMNPGESYPGCTRIHSWLGIAFVDLVVYFSCDFMVVSWLRVNLSLTNSNPCKGYVKQQSSCISLRLIYPANKHDS